MRRTDYSEIKNEPDSSIKQRDGSKMKLHFAAVSYLQKAPKCGISPRFGAFYETEKTFAVPF